MITAFTNINYIKPARPAWPAELIFLTLPLLIEGPASTVKAFLILETPHRNLAVAGKIN